MNHLIVLVLDSVELCPNMLDAWEKAGAGGVTILDSTGMRRVQGVLRDDLPLIPSMHDLLSAWEHSSHHRTLFTVVSDEATVDRIIAVTEAVCGDLSRPHTGLLFVVPVSRVLGLDKKSPQKPARS